MEAVHGSLRGKSGGSLRDQCHRARMMELFRTQALDPECLLLLLVFPSCLFFSPSVSWVGSEVWLSSQANSGPHQFHIGRRTVLHFPLPCQPWAIPGQCVFCADSARVSGKWFWFVLPGHQSQKIIWRMALANPGTVSVGPGSRSMYVHICSALGSLSLDKHL